MDNETPKEPRPQTNLVSNTERERLIRNTPGFSSLEIELVAQLADAMEEIQVKPGTIIVNEGDLVDSIYLLVEGSAEVSKKVDDDGKPGITLLAVLNQGESIGLKESGLYAAGSVRTATVTASTLCILLKITLDKLQRILHLAPTSLPAMKDNLSSALKLKLIRESAPFAQFTNEHLFSILSSVNEISFEAGDLIFIEGEVMDKCYIVYEGTVEVEQEDLAGKQKVVTTLEIGTLFGEGTFLTRGLKNILARAITPCRLLVLDRSVLLSGGSNQNNIYNQDLVSLLAASMRPVRAPNILYQRRSLAHGELIVTLKNPINYTYCQLNEQEWFVWQQLSGDLTPSEIALKTCKQFPALQVDDVLIILYDLLEKKFAFMDSDYSSKPLSKEEQVHTHEGVFSRFKWIYFLKQPDQVATFIYKHGGAFLVSIPAGLCYLILCIAGLIWFYLSTYTIVPQLPRIPLIPLWILLAISMTMMFNLFTPLIKILAIKRAGHTVPRIGLIWHLIGPAVYVDSSDLLMSPKGTRILVEIAGIIANLLIASLLSLYVYYNRSHDTAVFYWLCALMVYLKTMGSLDPMRNTVGYSLLVDSIDTSKLRAIAFTLFKESSTSVTFYSEKMLFWLACVLYLLINLICVSWLLNLLIYQWPQLAFLMAPALTLITASFLVEIVVEWQDQNKQIRKPGTGV